MALKRNKKAKAVVEAPVEAETIIEQVVEKPVVNADKMAAEVKVSGNDYQQYLRVMMKERLSK